MCLKVSHVTTLVVARELRALERDSDVVMYKCARPLGYHLVGSVRSDFTFKLGENRAEPEVPAHRLRRRLSIYEGAFHFSTKPSIEYDGFVLPCVVRSHDFVASTLSGNEACFTKFVIDEECIARAMHLARWQSQKDWLAHWLKRQQDYSRAMTAVVAPTPVPTDLPSASEVPDTLRELVAQ